MGELEQYHHIWHILENEKEISRTVGKTKKRECNEKEKRKHKFIIQYIEYIYIHKEKVKENIQINTIDIRRYITCCVYKHYHSQYTHSYTHTNI